MKGKSEDKEGIIIMTKVGGKIEIGQVVETDSEEHLTEVDLSIKKFREENFRIVSFRGGKWGKFQEI